MINFKNLWAEGDPDYFDICDGDTLVKGLDWRDEDALPFIFQDGKIYVGGAGRAHGSCGNPYNGLNNKTFAAGRIWFPNDNAFPYYVISFWYEDFERTIDASLLDQFLSRYNIYKDKVLLVSFEDDDYGTVYRYKDWHFRISKANEKQREHRAMHLMNANDKRDATYNFRKNRDSAQSKKLTNAAGDKQMTMAQYKSLIYQENRDMNKNNMRIRLTESDLHRIIKESVNKILRESEYDFASGIGNYDVNSDEWKTNYDRMSNDYRGQEKKNNSDLMDLQIAHHNGMKGHGGYNGELPKTKQMSPKGKAESIDTIISSGLRRVNDGISPSEAFSDFKPFSEEQKDYYSDDMISQYYIPIGTVYGDTFMLIYDTKKGKYIVPKEPIEL